MANAQRQPPFTRALTTNIAVPVIAFGLLLLGAVLWYGLATSREAARLGVADSLDHAAERLRILLEAAEMTADSAVRAADVPPVAGATLRPTLERLLSAFEQRPELSYLGIALARTGEYGTLERTRDGRILLWLFPGTRKQDATTRNFLLTDAGFVPNLSRPTDGYDPRTRSFYETGAGADPQGTWVDAYQWIVHDNPAQELWGLTFVRPLRDAAGQLLGVLDTDLDLPALNRFMEQVAREQGIDLKVVELGATPRLIGDITVQARPAPVPDDMQPLLDAGGAFNGRMVLDGERRWVAARRIDFHGTSWLIVASNNEPLLPLPLGRALYQLGGIGIATALGMVFLLLRMARRLGEPITRLEADVRRLEHGEPVAPQPTEGGFRETRELGAAFERMNTAVRTRESDLEAERDFINALMKALPGVFYHYDDHMHLLRWNSNHEQVTGYSAEELRNMTPTQFFAPEDRARVEENIRKMYEQGTGTIEADYLLKDGRRVPYLFSGIRFDYGGRRSFLGLGIDVSRARRAEDRFGKVVQSAPNAMILVSRKGLITLVNNQAIRLFGYEESELLGQLIDMLVPDAVRPRHAGLRDSFFANPQTRNMGVGRDLVGLRKDGTAIPIEIGLNPLQMEGELMVLASIVDITERKLQQDLRTKKEAAEAAYKAKGEMLAIASHDLKNPLASISGLAQIMLEMKKAEPAAPPQDIEFLQTIFDASSHMSDVVKGILANEGLEQQGLNINPEKLDLCALCDELIRFNQQSADRKHITIQHELAPGLSVHADKTRLREAFDNYLNNAIKYSPSGTTVTVVLKHIDGNLVEYGVRDQGPGLTDDDKTKLFMRFKKLSARPTGGEYSTGLGLSIVKLVVELHGGTVGCDSELGKGSYFWARLPAI